MKLNVYCVRDRQTVQFGNPMFLLSHGQATRGFSDEINRAAQDNALYQHPEDYDLYFCGSWDSDTGIFDCQTPVQIQVGKGLVLKQ